MRLVVGRNWLWPKWYFTPVIVWTKIKFISYTGVLFCGWAWCDVSVMHAFNLPHYWINTVVDDASVKMQEVTLFDKYSLQCYRSSFWLYISIPLKHQANDIFDNEFDLSSKAYQCSLIDWVGMHVIAIYVLQKILHKILLLAPVQHFCH